VGTSSPDGARCVITPIGLATCTAGWPATSTRTADGALDDPDLPDSLFAELARDADVGVRRRAAAYLRLDGDSLMFLTADDDSGVAEVVAAHPGVPAGWMRQLLDIAQL